MSCATSSSASATASPTGPCTPSSSRRSQAIRAKVGSDQVICALSGGVDSSVIAAMVHRAIGDQLTCIYVNNGLMRTGETEVDPPLLPGKEQAQGHRCRCHRLISSANCRAWSIPRSNASASVYGFIEIFEEEARKTRRGQISGPGHPVSRCHRVGGLSAARPRSNRTTMSAACRRS